MLLSFCIPDMDRTYDLKKIMHYLKAAAQESPPVEIVIVDYNSQDDLEDYIGQVRRENPWLLLTYRKYRGRDKYHMAHARNLTVKAANGEYIIIFSTDLYPNPGFLPTIRKIINETGADWVHTSLEFVGVIVLKKSEFMAAGGYDEQFELYGPEDKDLNARLHRRGVKSATFRHNLLGQIHTPDHEKTKNYSVQISKRHMSARMQEFLRENNEKGVLVANEGKEWGDWDWVG